MAEQGRMAFIGDADSVLGFRALGVETYTPASGDEAVEIFRSLVKEKASVVMITEDMLDHLQIEVDQVVSLPVPAIVVLPGVSGSKHMGEDTIRNLIIRAVGVDLMAEDEQ
ncbi:V-type ATP synthase subunit F [Candidatus Fermentibacteria bacterium]|nr:MAG: V-type ATP synthase subunit F [Candidatus Fermentibacteria bacterium]PIE52338.1 MAG: V-type ATP synthase subunit F [Candidatus Fermentibacteria bacterium]